MLKPICVVLAMSPGLAFAQSDPMTQDLCSRIADHLQTVSPMTLTIAEHRADGSDCVLTGLHLDLADAYEPDFAVAQAVIRGVGFEALLSDLTPLQSVEISLDNLQFLPQTPDPVFTYMLEVQQARNLVDVDISAHWDPADNILRMDRFEIDFPYDNAVRATVEIANADLGSLGALQTSLGGMAVTDMTLEVVSNGLFESYAAPVLIPLLPYDTADPRAKVEAMKAQALQAIADLPDAIFADATREALSALVQDMPTPGGTLAVHLTAEPGLGAVRFAPAMLAGRPETMDDIWPLLDGVMIDVRYDRVPVE